MKKKDAAGCIALLLAAALLAGCKGESPLKETASSTQETLQEQPAGEKIVAVRPAAEIMQLEEDFSAVRYDGDYGFDEFLEQGGASSDAGVVEYLADRLLSGLELGDLLGSRFGCSTISARNAAGEALFGRNFDWEACEAMVVEAHPENGYASLSTVNMEFITQNAGTAVGMALRMEEVKTLAALYAPLDGMNEKGLAVSVNMIQDSATLEQHTGKPGLTTTTAVRLLLDKAGDVEQALALLRQYDLHASMGMMIHFALADASGRSVAVEYVNHEMVVIETPVLTNFYLAEGEKKGIGTRQSHERYDILTGRLEKSAALSAQDMRDALDSVSKDNFGEFESTEWSIVFNQSTGEARYYHRENYETSYLFTLQ